ncbi:hypothetical protein ACYF6T_38975 [Streptomyces sp. 7R007]
MALLTTRQILLVGAAGGLTVLVGLIASALIGAALHTVISRAITAISARRERARVLEKARQQLTTFTTIDDLKD